MTTKEHRWVGFRREAVTYCVGWLKDGVVHPEGSLPPGSTGEPAHETRDMRLWRCACGAEVYTEASVDIRGTPCTGSDASHLRHRF